MKKIIFASVCLLMAVVTFAEGKPSLVSNKEIVKIEKGSVIKPVPFFINCYHQSHAFATRWQAEAGLTGYKSAAKASCIIDQADVYENENLEYYYSVTYQPASGVCSAGDEVCTWCEAIDNSPQLQLKP